MLKKNIKLIEDSFGIARGVRVLFERDHIDRLDRWKNAT